jgi:hypothetical protein
MVDAEGVLLKRRISAGPGVHRRNEGVGLRVSKWDSQIPFLGLTELDVLLQGENQFLLCEGRLVAFRMRMSDRNISAASWLTILVSSSVFVPMTFTRVQKGGCYGWNYRRAISLLIKF